MTMFATSATRTSRRTADSAGLDPLSLLPTLGSGAAGTGEARNMSGLTEAVQGERIEELGRCLIALESPRLLPNSEVSTIFPTSTPAPEVRNGDRQRLLWADYEAPITWDDEYDSELYTVTENTNKLLCDAFTKVMANPTRRHKGRCITYVLMMSESFTELYERRGVSRRLNTCIQCVPGALFPLPLAPGYQAIYYHKASSSRQLQLCL